MKKITKSFASLALAVLMSGTLAACGEKLPPVPPEDYEPTDEEVGLLYDLDSNPAVALRNNGEGLAATNPVNELKAEVDVVSLSLSKVFKHPQINEYAVGFEWALKEGTLNNPLNDEPYLAFANDPVDGSKLVATINYPEYKFIDDDGDSTTAEVINSANISLIGTVKFGTVEFDLEYKLTLIPTEVVPVMSIREVKKMYANDPSGSLNKRVSFTGRIFDHFLDTGAATSSHVYAGVFVHDGDESIMLYNQNNGVYKTVMTPQFWYGGATGTTSLAAIGDVVTVKGSLTNYNGLVQINGISYIVKEDPAKFANIPMKPQTVQMTDTIWNSLNSDPATAGGKTFVEEYIGSPVDYNNLTYVSGTVNTTGSVNAETGQWSGSRSVIVFKNAAGTNVQVHINYHVGADLVAEFGAAINGAVANTTKFNLSGTLSASNNQPEITPMGTGDVVRL